MFFTIAKPWAAVGCGLRIIYVFRRVLKAETPLLKQSLLRVQPLLKSISLSMENAIADSQNSQKFFLYSGHDITVRPLLYAFQIPENR